MSTDCLSTFMGAEFWPKGVYRRYRGRLRDTATLRNIAQKIRVNELDFVFLTFCVLYLGKGLPWFVKLVFNVSEMKFIFSYLVPIL